MDLHSMHKRFWENGRSNTELDTGCRMCDEISSENDVYPIEHRLIVRHRIIACRELGIPMGHISIGPLIVWCDDSVWLMIPFGRHRRRYHHHRSRRQFCSRHLCHSIFCAWPTLVCLALLLELSLSYRVQMMASICWRSLLLFAAICSHRLASIGKWIKIIFHLVFCSIFIYSEIICNLFIEYIHLDQKIHAVSHTYLDLHHCCTPRPMDSDLLHHKLNSMTHKTMFLVWND